jgi:hypothetical protein
VLAPTHILIAIHEAERQSDLHRWQLARAVAEARVSPRSTSRVQRILASRGRWLSVPRTAARTLARPGPAVCPTDASTCGC